MEVKMKKICVFLLGLVISLNASLVSAPRYSAFEAVSLIEKEYQEKRLSLDQKCLYLIYALRNHQDLPQRFKVLKEEELKCGTPLVMEVRRNWDKLSMEVRETIDQLLDRPEKPFSYATTNFVIHYDTTGEYPVYNHWEDTNPADGVPDYVNRVGEYMERSWWVEIDSMGYYAPPYDGTEGGDSLYDVYIDVPLGYAVPEDPSSQYPDRPYAVTSFIIIGNDLTIDRYPDDPLPFCKACCAHELHHACQFVFIGQIGIYPEDYNPWLLEVSSNWIEESVWDELNDVYYYLNDYLPVPHKSLYHEGGRHMYASWIWNQYLSENFGRDIVHSIWLKYMDTFACAAIDSVLRLHGTTMNDQFQEFAVWNWFTNYKDDGNHYSEGASFPTDTVVYAATHFFYPASQQIWTSAPQGYGANYVLFKTFAADTGTYELTFVGNSRYVYGVDLILHDLSGSSYLQMNLDGNPSGKVLIPDFESYNKVVMVVTHLFNLAEYYTGARYSYNLRKYPGFLAGDANADQEVDLVDAVYLINYLLKSGPPPEPVGAADVNCDGNGDLPDAVYLINYLFQGGPPPGDPDDDGLPDC
jgi:hypothetical protein